jgi:hypothetical protein
MHACKNCWFSAKKTYCSSCEIKRRGEAVDDALNGDSLHTILNILKDQEYSEVLHRGDKLDLIIRKMYMLNKDYLEFYLHKIQGTGTEAHLVSRINTHSNTALCPIVGWMIRAGLYDHSINICCLRCMIHLMRYGTTRDVDSLKYSIQFDLYGPEHINIRAAVAKNKKNLPLLIDMANALLERGDCSYVLRCYNEILRRNISSLDCESYSQTMKHHPLLHKAILALGEINDKKELYLSFRERKDPFWEELIAKSMHPSRVMQWCMTEDEKQGFTHIPDYIFSDGRAEWNINFC